MNINFKGKTILVTGAGKGIGRELCLRLSEYGGRVVAISKTKDNLTDLVNEMKERNYPGEIEGVEADLTEFNLIKDLISRYEPYHCLVNNAGVAILEPFLTASLANYDRVMNVNLKAAFNVGQVVSNSMIEHNIKGTIVNVSSQASMKGLENHAAYCISKGGMDQLTRIMSLELGRHGIRVNSVNPTVVNTEMGKIGWSDPIKANKMKEKIPLNRFAEVGEVVDAIIYLLSEKSSMINGAILPIDGGYLAS